MVVYVTGNVNIQIHRFVPFSRGSNLSSPVHGMYVSKLAKNLQEKQIIYHVIHFKNWPCHLVVYLVFYHICMEKRLQYMGFLYR